MGREYRQEHGSFRGAWEGRAQFDKGLGEEGIREGACTKEETWEWEEGRSLG